MSFGNSILAEFKYCLLTKSKFGSVLRGVKSSNVTINMKQFLDDFKISILDDVNIVY